MQIYIQLFIKCCGIGNLGQMSRIEYLNSSKFYTVFIG